MLGPYAPRTMTMAALWDEVGTLGAAATDTGASTAIALTSRPQRCSDRLGCSGWRCLRNVEI
jgi:hypothetical protein